MDMHQEKVEEISIWMQSFILHFLFTEVFDWYKYPEYLLVIIVGFLFHGSITFTYLSFAYLYVLLYQSSVSF